MLAPIASLDLVADARILTKLGLRDESIVSYLMCTTQMCMYFSFEV
jgi:hypothetical protein